MKPQSRPSAYTYFIYGGQTFPRLSHASRDFDFPHEENYQVVAVTCKSGHSHARAGASHVPSGSGILPRREVCRPLLFRAACSDKLPKDVFADGQDKMPGMRTESDTKVAKRGEKQKLNAIFANKSIHC